MQQRVTSKRVVKGPAPPQCFVQQRLGAKDCLIATVATVTGIDYTKIAEAFGIPLNQRGIPDADALGPGIYLNDAVIPLYRLGWVATPLITKEHPELPDDLRQQHPDRYPSSDLTKSLIAGRKAIVSYIDEDETVGAHSLVWNGKEAIDCTDGVIVDLDGLTLIEALLMGRAAAKG